MRIECENCHSVYDVAEGAIPAEGREVQCAKCDHIWHQMPVAAPIPPLTLSEAINEAPAPTDEAAAPPVSAPVTEPSPASTEPENSSEPEVAFEPAPEPEAETTEIEEDLPEAETTEFRSYQAEILPDAEEEPAEKMEDILGAEAAFAREQRELTSEEIETESALERLRERVFDDAEEPEAAPEFEEATPLDPPSDPIGETMETAEETVEDAADAVSASIDSAADDAVDDAAEEAPAIPSAFRRLGEQRPTPIVEPEETADDAETEEEPKAAAIPPAFRQLSAKPKTEDAATPADAEAADEPAPAAAPEPVKRKRQSLADLSAGMDLNPDPAPQTSTPEVATAPQEPVVAETSNAAEPAETDVESTAQEMAAEPTPLEDTPPPPRRDLAAGLVAEANNDALAADDFAAPAKSRGLGKGFIYGLLLIALLVLLYFVAPMISGAVPALAPILDGFRSAIDGALASAGIDFAGMGDALRSWSEAV